MKTPVVGFIALPKPSFFRVQKQKDCRKCATGGIKFLPPKPLSLPLEDTCKLLSHKFYKVVICLGAEFTR